MAPAIKICGVTRSVDAALAVELGADFIGLNFYRPSPRCVAIERAREIRRAVAGRARIVGVFVNAPRDCVERVRFEVPLDVLQFHGDEDDDTIAGWPLPVIRACRLGSGAGVALPNRGCADYLLIDSYDPVRFGGTGRRLAHKLLRRLDLSGVFVAGGLLPENVAAVAALNPFAVDVAGGVESAPGLKDERKLRSFIVNAKSAGQPR